MRYFNTYGPVNAHEHYIVLRHALVEQLVAQIEQGKYFTIYAPRQMGKTTLLYSLEAALRRRPGSILVVLSFEAFESWSAGQFWQEVASIIGEEIAAQVCALDHPAWPTIQALLAEAPPNDLPSFRRFFRSLYQRASDLNVILIIDEFDGTPPEVLSPLLQMWRSMYLERARRPHSLHSVILLGIQNVARLNFGRSSPFNIAYQHRLEPFSMDEVRDLLGQYSVESGQVFTPGVIEKLYEQTAGQPFLVNRTAAILTAEVVPEHTRPITPEDVRMALQRLVRESNYNFETVVRRAAEYAEDVLKIIFGASYSFTLNDPLVNTLHLFGILKETPSGACAIANPIYQRVLIDYLRPRQMGLQGAILANGDDFRPYGTGKQLQMVALLTRFREFVERRGREAFKVTPMPQEATGQYLLMAYLDIVVRQLGGDLFTEVNSGEGRLDVIVVHQGRRYVIETKIWRGPVLYEEGLTQLATYLESEGQATGYYVLFHARPNVYGKLPYEQLEFATQAHGKTIHVFLVRLGHVFDDEV